MGTIITVSREYGAGGHSIARRVAQELGIEIYDRDIIRSAVKDTGLDTSIVEHEEEEISRGSAFLRMIAPAAYVDQREAIHEIERKAILMLAAKGPCVILGRCADAARHSYYQQFSGRRWGDFHNYNLMLDSGLLGYDACVKLICEAARAL